MRSLFIIIAALAVNVAHADPDFDRFLALIQANDVVGVTEFLDSHPKYEKINFADEEQLQRRPIFFATSEGMVMLLMSRGAVFTKTKNNKVPYKDEQGNNILHVLAQNAAALRKANPHGEAEIMARIRATALLLIRMDMNLNGPRNLILAMPNNDGMRARNAFARMPWDLWFLDRLDSFDKIKPIPENLIDVPLPRPVATPLGVTIPKLALRRPVVQIVLAQDYVEETLANRPVLLETPAIPALELVELVPLVELELERAGTPDASELERLNRSEGVDRSATEESELPELDESELVLPAWFQPNSNSL